MPDKNDIENILSKIDQLYESRNATEKLLIRIDERVKVIVERGCLKGEQMNRETNKKIDSMQKLYFRVTGAVAAVGAGLGYYFKK